MNRLYLSCIALVGVAVACSSSSSDPSPSPSDAGVDATSSGGDAGNHGDAAHAVTACTSKIQTTCLISSAGGGAGCSVSADHCSEGHSYTADCDGDGNCLCSVDGVPTCTCSTGVATCDGGSCDCPIANGFCCFTGTAGVAGGG